MVGLGTSSTRAKWRTLSECTHKCAQKMLDTADIVREAILQQLSSRARMLAVCRLENGDNLFSFWPSPHRARFGTVGPCSGTSPSDNELTFVSLFAGTSSHNLSLAIFGGESLVGSEVVPPEDPKR